MNFPITNKYLTIHEALILHSGILAFILSSSIQESNINKENQLLLILLGMFILKDTWSVKILTAFLCILAKFMICIHHSHKQLVISAVVLFSHHDVQMLCFCTVSNQHNQWCNDNKGHEYVSILSHKSQAVLFMCRCPM
jgi:hypothetical protein